MFSILRPSYRAKPSRYARPNFQHKHFKGVVARWSFLGGSLFDLISNAKLTVTGSLPTLAPEGYVFVQDVANYFEIDASNLTGTSPTNETIHCRVIPRSVTAEKNFYSSGSAHNDGSPARFFSINASDQTRTLPCNRAWTTFTSAIPLDREVVHTVTHDGDTWKVYFDGVLQTNDTIALSNCPLENLYLGRGAFSTANFTLVDFVVSNRTWSEVEIRDYAANPWEAWERRIWVPVGVPVGGITVTPNPVTAVGASVAPTVIKGSITFTPTEATAVGASVAPTVVFGSVTISGLIASGVGATVDPSVIISGGSIVVTPGAVTGVGATVAPTVVLGSLTLSPTAVTAVGATVDPTVQEGGLLITPIAAAAIGAVTGPTVLLGATSVTPVAASAIGVTIDPTVDDSTGLPVVNATEDRFAPSQRYQFRGLFSEVIYSKQLVDTLSISGDSATIINFTVPGAELNDVVMVSTDGDPSSVTWTGYVTSADTVELTIRNNAGASKDLSNTTWTVYVMKHVRV